MDFGIAKKNAFNYYFQETKEKHCVTKLYFIDVERLLKMAVQIFLQISFLALKYFLKQ